MGSTTTPRRSNTPVKGRTPMPQDISRPVQHHITPHKIQQHQTQTGYEVIISSTYERATGCRTNHIRVQGGVRIRVDPHDRIVGMIFHLTRSLARRAYEDRGAVVKDEADLLVYHPQSHYVSSGDLDQFYSGAMYQIREHNLDEIRAEWNRIKDAFGSNPKIQRLKIP